MILALVILTSCSKSSPIKLTEQEGKFLKPNSEIISNKYEIKSNNGFFASIDFDLKEGKVEWEIVNPKGEVVFKGYVVNESDETYRQLTSPTNFLGGRQNQKEVVKDETDLKGNIIHAVDFGGLQFDVGSPSGVYILSLKPINAEGSYTVKWSDGLPRK